MIPSEKFAAKIINAQNGARKAAIQNAPEHLRIALSNATDDGSLSGILCPEDGAFVHDPQRVRLAGADYVGVESVRPPVLDKSCPSRIVFLQLFAAATSDEHRGGYVIPEDVGLLLALDEGRDSGPQFDPDGHNTHMVVAVPDTLPVIINATIALRAIYDLAERRAEDVGSNDPHKYRPRLDEAPGVVFDRFGSEALHRLTPDDAGTIVKLVATMHVSLSDMLGKDEGSAR